jgi:hypothetical protein
MLPFFVDVGSEIPCAEIAVFLEPLYQNVEALFRERGLAVPKTFRAILFVGAAEQRAKCRVRHRRQHAFSCLPTQGLDPTVDIHGRRSFSEENIVSKDDRDNIGFCGVLAGWDQSMRRVVDLFISWR